MSPSKNLFSPLFYLIILNFIVFLSLSANGAEMKCGEIARYSGYGTTTGTGSDFFVAYANCSNNAQIAVNNIVLSHTPTCNVEKCQKNEICHPYSFLTSIQIAPASAAKKDKTGNIIGIDPWNPQAIGDSYDKKTGTSSCVYHYEFMS